MLGCPWEEKDNVDDQEDVGETQDLSWIHLPWIEMENVEVSILKTM
jgi:hypothetical protein